LYLRSVDYASFAAHFSFSLSMTQGGVASIPIRILFVQLIRLLVIPVFIGFIVRSYKPDFVRDYGKILRRIGFVALGFLIGIIFYQTWDLFVASWLEIVKAGAFFVLLSMMVGYGFGILFRLNQSDAFTLSIEYGTRNTAICTATAVIILHRTEFATFAAIYFLVEAVLIIPLILIFQRFMKTKSIEVM
jgi:bile acid:Na+ symporter, BASS family